MPHLRSVNNSSLAFKLDIVLKTDEHVDLQPRWTHAGLEVQACAWGAVGTGGRSSLPDPHIVGVRDLETYYLIVRKYSVFWCNLLKNNIPTKECTNHKCIAWQISK